MIKGLPQNRDPYHSTRKNGSALKADNKPDSGGLPSMAPPMDLGGMGMGDLNESNAVIWEPFQLPNKQDLGFRRTDGFFLRARKLKSIAGKWMAQLYRNDKILDKGQVIIPDGFDAEAFIKQIANYMLDGNSFRYQQDPNISPPDETESEEPTETISANGQYNRIEPEPELPEPGSDEGLPESPEGEAPELSELPQEPQQNQEEPVDISDLDLEELES